MTAETLGTALRNLLMAAWLLPLLGFAIEVLGGYWSDRKSKTAAYLAVGCIGIGFICSFAALMTWGTGTGWVALASHDSDHETHSKDVHHKGEHHNGDGKHIGEQNSEQIAKGSETEPQDGEQDATQPANHDVKTVFSGTLYTLGKFGPLEISLDWYIDSLTLIMFTMVTFIATCIHIFAMGYMSDELTEDHEDHEVHMADGSHFHRPGRFYKFFSYLSLFSFSMLGLVLAGNIFQVFIFWELVGVCSYLLIGFYVERHSASTAANKAFIMNRVGDFGFLIGLMIIITSFGTFRFANHTVDGHNVPGLFTLIRGNDGELKTDSEEHPSVAFLHNANGEVSEDGTLSIPYYLLVIAGLGIFAGCVGKSAQFPLQTWLPDAMEGPTPVSALVHSATMVAAGVYLAGRFFPVFTPEVLLTIAYAGCITLFMAATIAIVATDIKRVLAYSTISQLGYMMLAIGVGGWGAGLFHLITHAFFKSLMFLASGSVIYACHHVQEMPQMGGLRKKLPITSMAMLVGVIAISGLAIPGTPIAFSGFHSKDAIVATSLAYTKQNPAHYILFFAPLITAGITAFYMFRLWFYTFAGEPRDQHVYDHAHESPKVMTWPLIALSVLAAFCALGGESGFLYKMLGHSEPIGLADGVGTSGSVQIALPGHHDIHEVHSEAGSYALIAAMFGTFLAYILYGAKWINPADIQKPFAYIHRFLVDKWKFDELYDVMCVRPVHVVASWFAGFDKKYLDGFLHFLAGSVVKIASVSRSFDEKVVDGFVNKTAETTQTVGSSMRKLQTGSLRQYIMFIALGVIGLFVLLMAMFPKT